uniref:Palmitoyltransferase n=2 Tax=Hemiselmis andersenii TaxID=464988 RepID=A0A7S1H2W7_HEMAN|mmetsp:Transcript_32675/g.79731  ORF Transcript_32675/g.79731 Transcript_32675/m.79731 type:complete len:446 (+) Transcript_32675:3-1340(+)
MGYANVGAICFTCVLAIVSVGSGVPRVIELLGDGAAAGILVLYFLIVLQMLIAYWRVCQVSPGRPVEIFGQIDTSGDAQRPIVAVNGKELKVCYKCKSYKPDRCHHCSDCEQCTLRMDHHCPWVNNCIGFRNYKYFFLFLTYSTLACSFTIGILIWLIVTRGYDWFSAWDIVYTITCACVGIFLCGAVGLLVYHSILMTSNQTTIEQLKQIHASTFSIGCFTNIQQVLGSSPVTWCCPCVWGVSEDFDGVQWDHPKERLSGIVSSPPFSPHATSAINHNGGSVESRDSNSHGTLYPPYGPSTSHQNGTSSTSYNTNHPLSLVGLGFPESSSNQGQQAQQHTSTLSYEPGWQHAPGEGLVRQVKVNPPDREEPRPPPRAVAYSINPPMVSQESGQGIAGEAQLVPGDASFVFGGAGGVQSTSSTGNGTAVHGAGWSTSPAAPATLN